MTLTRFSSQTVATRRILVVRALQLGDLLCAVPALRALRRWAPDAHITLCGLPWSRGFVNRYAHLVDDHCEFPGYPGIPEVPCSATRWQQWLARWQGNFDLVVQLHGSGTYINDFVRTLNAAETAGFHPSDQPSLALDYGCAWPESGHEIQRLKQVVLQLGAPDCGDELELPITDEEQRQAGELLKQQGHGREHPASKPLICLHAGGRSLTRRWPIERYAAVARQLIDTNHTIVLTGTTAEADLASQLQQRLDRACIDLVGRTTLGQMMAIIDRAQLLLTNDTGASHIAAACQTPSVVIGLGSDLARWLPLNRQLHRAVYASVACRPCYTPGCPTQFECAQAVHPQMVIDAVQQQLALASRSSANRTDASHLETSRIDPNSIGANRDAAIKTVNRSPAGTTSCTTGP